MSYFNKITTTPEDNAHLDAFGRLEELIQILQVYVTLVWS